jgi:threonylcarbamoyladenosine tRNA methylthiotransferase MtaB
MIKDAKGTRVALDTLGCKLNQAETGLIARQLAEAGCRLVSPADAADIYILNTCTVTHIADSKSRHRLRLARRRNPDALLVAIGCYPQRAGEELARIDGVGLAVGNGDKMRLVSLLREAGYLAKTADTRPAGSPDGSRNRAFIKVQDGCDNFCTYCIVPLVRGMPRSLPADEIVAGAGAMVARGYKELVLTGTEIGCYSDDGLNLAGLTGRILSETGVGRLRLTSLQPPEIAPELVALWHEPRLCRHFHLSLQSGSDSVLKRMQRRYSVSDYQKAVALIRSVVPEAAITTDVIVGFPGETEDEFRDSYSFCQKLGFARIHVFPFSPRPGTEAARMPAKVCAAVKKQRSQKILALAEASAGSFRQRFLGRSMPVLWEQQSKGGIWSGLTDNYIRVYTRSDSDLANKLLPVKLVRLYRDGVWGEGVNKNK